MINVPGERFFLAKVTNVLLHGRLAAPCLPGTPSQPQRRSQPASKYWIKNVESDKHGHMLFKGIVHFNSYNV